MADETVPPPTTASSLSTGEPTVLGAVVDPGATAVAGGSYLSVDDPRVHFGLGSCSKLDLLQIRWPDGRAEVLNNVAVDRYLTVDEPF